MRHETYQASHAFVTRLQAAGTAAHVRDEGDVLHLTMHSAARVAVHIIERPTSEGEMQAIYGENTAAGWHTLCLFQVAHLLPNPQTWYAPDPWMEMLLRLHHDQIYAYDAVGRNAYFFPVHFAPLPRHSDETRRRIRWGDLIDMATLHTEHIDYAGLTWRTAMFGGPRIAAPVTSAALMSAYAQLGLRGDEPLEAVKRAYRALARQYHPDVNPGREAHYRMKEINGGISGDCSGTQRKIYDL